MLLSEILESRPMLDADYIAERVEAEIIVELFGGLGGIARAGVNTMKQAGQAVKGAYNDGEVKGLLSQLGKYKEQLKTLIQRNPQAFAQQQAPTIMQARPAANPAKAQYQQDRSAARTANREAQQTTAQQSNRLSSLSSAEHRLSGQPMAARRRVSNPGTVSNFAPVERPAADASEMPSMQPRQRKPHIKLRSPRAHMESQEVHDEIILELFGGLGGIARTGMDAAKRVGKSIGKSYAKGEAQAIIQKMMNVVAALRERGYQLPPELAREIQIAQQAAT